MNRLMNSLMNRLMNKLMNRLIETALVDAKICQKEDLVRTEFVYWSIHGLGTGREIHRKDPCIKCVSNVF